ncbi:tetratricopeptide repeat protein [Chryseolinea lacunae]|uniref:Tetratricopeptide repeat protein n=1 Tax=Chryseolinea lacunae TaxID=2801331 RepID=A0ABS1KTI2_9BACT|nr:tetratricopeptide repeat protein [Chryseolinea lacunae]MBL0742527.1 tetratricopeptide repeat protein [Chryseolinea lacunae]
MKFSFIILFIVASTGIGQAQFALPDSIQQRFAGVPRDSVYVTKLNSLATHYLKTNPTASRRIASYVINVSSNIKFTRGYARALTVMGNSYWYEGIYEFAQNYYLLAARQYLSIQDSVGLSGVYNNIGEVNKRLGEQERALEYLQRSMELKRNDSTRALTLYNIGELYINLKQYGTAEEYINQSLTLAQMNRDERVIAYDHWSIARISVERKDFSKAFREFELAEDAWIRLGETRSLIQTYEDMAYAYRVLHKIEDARTYLNRASALASKLQVPDLRISIYMEYSRLDSARGNYAGAYHYLTRHNALKDSVYSLLKSEQIERVQAIYETEIRERENRELRIEKELKDAQLSAQKKTIAAVSAGLLITIVFALILFRQRRKILHANKDLKEKNEEIHEQKSAIEMQAASVQKLNETLQELNRTLEGRIDERSRQLLVQNQKVAEYTFMNAHKLRAPVASMLGLISLIQQADPTEHEIILKHLKTCGEQLDRVIREISQNLETSLPPGKIPD